MTVDREPQPNHGPGLATILALSACAFCVLGSYAIARPSMKALLLQHYGKEALPYAWLLVALGVTVTVSVYSRFAARMELRRLYRWAVVWTCVTLCFALSLYHAGFEWAVFLLFVWKDIYIVLLIEMFWTCANSIFQLKTAKWLYGVFLSVGTLGGITANLSVGELARTLGVGHAPWLVLPMLFFTAVLISGLPEVRPERSADESKASFHAGFALVWRSRYLMAILGIIASIQLALNLVDFQLSAMVEASHVTAAGKTAEFGRIYGMIDGAALTMQLGGGVLITVLGVSGVLVSAPIVLLVTLSCFIFMPTLGLISVAFIAGKSMDYSVYRTAKEALYLPLAQRERALGKAVIDIMVYRVAKAGAAIFLLALSWLGDLSASTAVIGGLAVAAVSAWLFFALRVLPIYGQKTNEQRDEAVGEA
ncbi:MAG: Npt1/Npt2 family nucleotide transporter [Bradymonadia bacterium]